MELIDDDEAAMEISDGIWAPIKVKDLNTYMNFYWKSNRRGSWKFLSPAALWEKLMGKKPTEAQHHLMVNFLEQNRTHDMVQRRAAQLMADMCEQYPDKIKLIQKKTKRATTWMFIRGQIADWVITDNTYKTDIQNGVHIYLFP